MVTLSDRQLHKGLGDIFMLVAPQPFIVLKMTGLFQHKAENQGISICPLKSIIWFSRSFKGIKSIKKQLVRGSG